MAKPNATLAVVIVILGLLFAGTAVYFLAKSNVAGGVTFEQPQGEEQELAFGIKVTYSDGSEEEYWPPEGLSKLECYGLAIQDPYLDKYISKITFYLKIKPVFTGVAEELDVSGTAKIILINKYGFDKEVKTYTITNEVHGPKSGQWYVVWTLELTAEEIEDLVIDAGHIGDQETFWFKVKVPDGITATLTWRDGDTQSRTAGQGSGCAVYLLYEEHSFSQLSVMWDRNIEYMVAVREEG